MYDLILTKEAQAFYQSADDPLAKKLNRCFDQLRHNPYQHPNIKRLRGPLAGYLRYRLGDWRVVFQVDETASTVVVLLIAHRSKAYD